MAHVPTTKSQAKPEGSKKPAKPEKGGKKGGPAGEQGDAAAPAGPSSRVTIALPFSQIRMSEPSVELAGLVAVVGDLVSALKGTLPPAQQAGLEAQIQSLRARLG